MTVFSVLSEAKSHVLVPISILQFQGAPRAKGSNPIEETSGNAKVDNEYMSDAEWSSWIWDGTGEYTVWG